MRPPCTFRKSDVRRAVEAVEAIGKPVAAVEIEKDGTIRVLFGDPQQPAPKANSWDR